MTLSITLIGGPTALIEVDGFRLLTDPTFDAPGAYQLPHVKLEKLSGPALGPETIGEVDAVLLSHDQHADNLDHSGKAFLAKARRVLEILRTELPECCRRHVIPSPDIRNPLRSLPSTGSNPVRCEPA